MQRVVVGAQHVQLLLGKVADAQALAFGHAPAMGAISRAMVLTSVDLPWPLAPRMPMRWPAITLRLTPRRMTLSPGAMSGSSSPRRQLLGHHGGAVGKAALVHRGLHYRNGASRNGLGPVAKRRVADGQHGVGQAQGLAKLELEVGAGQHRGQLFHALQRLHAALRLLGLGGLGLEAVDELLQVGNLVLLLGKACCCSTICCERSSSNAV
jgi:hypothetical protein